MKNLFNFIQKHIHWLLFFFLTFLSLLLLIHNNEFQRSKYLSVFQEIAGRVYFVSGSVQSYLNLKQTNSDLMERIAVLEEETQGYKKQLEILTDRIPSDSINIGLDQAVYHYTHARVIRNRVSGINNYMLLNKGSNDGITKDMAVVSARGIVGVVTNVSPHFSQVMSALNSEYNLSCMIQRTRFSGSLFWDGKDPRYTYLSRLPGHSSYITGDTIVTSGYSFTFPEGVFVGVVEDVPKQQNKEYNSLKIRLFTDFSTLSEVLIIRNSLREEQIKIEKGVNDE